MKVTRLVQFEGPDELVQAAVAASTERHKMSGEHPDLVVWETTIPDHCVTELETKHFVFKDDPKIKG